MNRNFQLELDRLISGLGDKTPSLLLHSCCAPCSSYTLEYLTQYFSITVFYYNPNISPSEEFYKRAAEQKRLISELPVKNPVSFIEGDYDYSEFLRKFAAINETVKVSDDEFDYIYYNYGLQHYHKMPLIEPLEYREDNRIRDFVIAIDTSGSVAGEEVQSFLQKTYGILRSR